jgi:hypothetical protein
MKQAEKVFFFVRDSPINERLFFGESIIRLVITQQVTYLNLPYLLM